MNESQIGFLLALALLSGSLWECRSRVARMEKKIERWIP